MNIRLQARLGQSRMYAAPLQAARGLEQDAGKGVPEGPPLANGQPRKRAFKKVEKGFHGVWNSYCCVCFLQVDDCHPILEQHIPTASQRLQRRGHSPETRLKISNTMTGNNFSLGERMQMIDCVRVLVGRQASRSSLAERPGCSA